VDQFIQPQSRRKVPATASTSPTCCAAPTAKAAGCRHKREELLQATEAELLKVRAILENPRGRLLHADAGTIGERVGRISTKYKMAKRFLLGIGDGAFSFEREEEKIAREAALDGLYVLRTTCGSEELGPGRWCGPTSS